MPRRCLFFFEKCRQRPPPQATLSQPNQVQSHPPERLILVEDFNTSSEHCEEDCSADPPPRSLFFPLAPLDFALPDCAAALALPDLILTL